METTYKIELVLHNASLKQAGEVEAALFKLVEDRAGAVEIVRFSPLRVRDK